MEHLEVRESPLGDTEEDSLKKQNSSWTSQAWVDPQEVFFIALLRSMCHTLEEKHNKTATCQNIRQRLKEPEILPLKWERMPPFCCHLKRDHWGVNNVIPYMCSKTLPSSVFLFKLFSTLRSVPYFSSKSPPQPHQVTLFAAIKTC